MIQVMGCILRHSEYSDRRSADHRVYCFLERQHLWRWGCDMSIAKVEVFWILWFSLLTHVLGLRFCFRSLGSRAMHGHLTLKKKLLWKCGATCFAAYVWRLIITHIALAAVAKSQWAKWQRKTSQLLSLSSSGTGRSKAKLVQQHISRFNK